MNTQQIVEQAPVGDLLIVDVDDSGTGLTEALLNAPIGDALGLVSLWADHVAVLDTLVVDLPAGAILTTNYDFLLEGALSSAGTVQLDTGALDAVGSPVPPLGAAPDPEPQERLRAQWPAILARAAELEELYPDPVQSMIDLLKDLPGDYDTWREILEEPYG